ncbi:hypothetical protein [Haladaptatus sp. R4]
MESGTTITVFTPGGGGHGPAEERDPDAIEMDRDDGKMEWEE